MRVLTMAVALSVFAMPLAAAVFEVNLNDATAIANHGTVQDFNLSDPDCDVDNNPAPPHNCTLFAAIQQANFNANRDRIQFLAGLDLITLSTGLPSIAHPVDIEGNVSGSNPLTAINAANNGLLSFDNAASLNGGSSVKNLKLMNASGTGIRLDGSPYILDNLWVGLNVAGTAAAGNSQNGIEIQNTVSKAPPILSNLDDLLSALGISSFGELFTAFGSNPAAFVTAATALLGTNNAIAITNSVISGNGDAGVRIAGGQDGMGNDVLTAGVILAGNHIGTNALGTNAVPNGTGTSGDGSGVLIELNAALNFVIANVIAANQGQGVNISTGEVDFPNVVGGNFIGLPNPVDVPNPLSLGPNTWGNYESGVFIGSRPSAGNASETAAVVAANFIGFNRCGTWSDADGLPPFSPDAEDGGIAVTGTDSDKTVLVGNLIGVAQFPPSGGSILDLGNLCTGINVAYGSNIIGGANILDANAIGANDGDGILLRTSNTNGNVVKGNRIGRDYLDTLTFPNDGYGIRLDNSGGNIVGFEPGDAPLFGPNIIAAPGASGIRLNGTNAFGNLLSRNRIYGVPANFIGIELDRDGFGGQDIPDPIDDDDNDVNPLDYANWGQNAPQICSTGDLGACAGATSPSFGGGNTNIQWTLFSFRNATFRIDFYSISDDDAKWLGEVANLTTDATTGVATSNGPCNAAGLCTSSFASANTSGTQIVMTATRIDPNIADIPPLEPVPPNPPGSDTDDGPINNTSEYSAPATIPDQIVFSSANYIVAESDGNATITLSRNGTGAASITLNLTEGTTQPADHDALSSTTLTWAADEAPDKVVTLPIVQDNIDEPNQSLSLDFVIDSSDNAVAGTPATAQVTITDDDASPLLTIAGTGAVEGDQLVYTVTRNGASEFTTSVDYAVTPDPGTEAGDIAAGVDPLSGTVSIAPGAGSATISVLAVDDAIHEPAEVVRTELSNPVNGMLNAIGGNFALASIAASDAPVVFNIDNQNLTETDANVPLVFTVTKVGLTEFASSVGYDAIAGTAVTPADYAAGVDPLSGTLNFAAGDTQRTISLTLVGDDVFEPAPDQTFNVQLSNASQASIGTGTGTATITDDDAAQTGEVRFTSVAFDVNETEASTNAVVVVERVNGSDGPASVDCIAAAGTATAGADFTAGSVGVSWNTGESGTRQCLIPIAGDLLDEDDETVTLSLGNVAGSVVGSPATATLTILDNDALPVVSIVAPIPTAEGNAPDITPFTFLVTLSAASGRNVTALATSTDGSATVADNDYQAVNQSLTFLPGETSKMVAASVIGDAADEGDQTFSVSLSNVVNATPQDTPETATATIVNDDAPPPAAGQLRFTAATFGVNESAGPAVVTVERVNGTAGAVMVDCVAGVGTATAADFTPATQTLNWGAGIGGTQNCSVAINNDLLDEDDETVLLALGNVQGGASLVSPSAATLTIADDDAMPIVSIADLSLPEGNGPGATPFAFLVTLSEPSGRAVSAQATTSDGSAVAGGDYASLSATVNFAPGDTSEMFTVSVVGDAVDEGADEAFDVTLSAPNNATLGANAVATGTIQNDDAVAPAGGTLQFSAATYSVGEAGVQATITVTRTGGSSGAVGVTYASSDGSATIAGNDYTAAGGTLSWLAGDVADKTFTVPINNDSTDEPDETVNLALSLPTGGAALGAPSTSVLTITDDDLPSVNGSLQFSAATYAVGESGVAATITVTRTGGSSGPVGVTYATTDGTATIAGSDYTATGGTLSWLSGDVADKTFTVPINNDAIDELDETVNLALSLPTGGASLGAPNTAVLTITDDDAPVSGVKIFSGPTQPGSGTQTIVFTGGGDPCGFDAGSALVAAPQPLPAGGYVFPHGVFASTISNCTTGATLSFTVTYPQALAAGTVFWKYGRTQANPTAHWYQYPAAIVGATATYTLTDGGAGDDDLLANGTIVDPSGPAFAQGFGVPATPQPIPTLGDYGRWLLLAMVGLLAAFAMRQRQ
ncbi:MAG: hypothetical protein IPP28_07185 [Xanthomonadales bacterium]|nr:hypothetical protein [Xanthomonadales bacterium]